MLKGVIVGSTRPNRIGLGVAARADGRATFELVDVADFDLPLMDEPLPPSLGQYTKYHSKRLAPPSPSRSTRRTSVAPRSPCRSERDW